MCDRGSPVASRDPFGATADYTVESLPVDVDRGWMGPLQLNDQGRVIGIRRARDRPEAWQALGFVWDRQSGLCDLGWGKYPQAINAAGLVGGNDLEDEDTWQPFLFEPATGLRDIGVPGDWRKLSLTALNDAGQFAGTAENGVFEDTLPSEAYRWDPATGWTGVGRDSGVQDLNNDGQVLVNVSGSDEPALEHRQFLWTPGNPPRDLAAGHTGMLNNAGQAVTIITPTTVGAPEQTQLWDLATGHQLAAADGHAYGINDKGQVILEFRILSADPRALVLDRRGRLTDLGTLPGADWATPRGINNRGQVVGFSGTGPPGDAELPGTWFHAFLWDPRTGMRDLGTLSRSHDSQAVAINDAGQVIGWSGKSGPKSATPAVLWTPRP